LLLVFNNYQWVIKAIMKTRNVPQGILTI
jgi:hypothetical protein